MDARQLVIDGDDVLFAIKYSGQAMAVPRNGKTDTGKLTLTATVRQGGAIVWSGVIQTDVTIGPITVQFSDHKLRQLYRAARRPDNDRGASQC